MTPTPYDHDHENEVVPFAETNFRNEHRRFGIKTDDRRRHMYVLGKTGMGKTTLLENMVLADIYAGHGLAYIDPHGDTAEKIIDFIPSYRINDVIYFNPADQEFPIGFNVLETVDERHKHLVAAGLMGVFKKIWPDVWSARMEYIMNNCILGLLDFPGSTLLGINRLLVDRDFRKRVIGQLKDPVVRTFWVDEYSAWEDRFRNEAIAPIQNKVGQFLSASIIRNIVAQVKSTIDVRKIMDERKIFVVNLAKGRIGEDNSRLLGGMLITKLQLAAMERVDIPEPSRQDFYLYVDEFQNFATSSFANILSEARKYRLNLIMAHQYIEQLDEEYVRPAVFGNVGTIILFRIGAKDAEFLENEFAPRFTIEDMSNITKFQVYLKLMIDGVASAPFSANTLAPIAQRTMSIDKVIKVTRERYTQPRSEIEEKVNRWSGMGSEGDTPEALDERLAKAEAQANARGGGGGGKKAAKVMYDYVCTRCGKKIQLPVKLDPSRPIYCDDCLPVIRGEKPVSEGPVPLSTFKGGGAGGGAAPRPPATTPTISAPMTAVQAPSPTIVNAARITTEPTASTPVSSSENANTVSAIISKSPISNQNHEHTLVPLKPSVSTSSIQKTKTTMHSDVRHSAGRTPESALRKSAGDDSRRPREHAGGDTRRPDQKIVRPAPSSAPQTPKATPISLSSLRPRENISVEKKEEQRARGSTESAIKTEEKKESKGHEHVQTPHIPVHHATIEPEVKSNQTIQEPVVLPPIIPPAKPGIPPEAPPLNGTLAPGETVTFE